MIPARILTFVAVALVSLALAAAGRPAARAGWGYGQSYVACGGVYRSYGGSYYSRYNRPVHYRSLLLPRSYSPGLRYNYANLRYARPAYYVSPLRYRYASISYAAPVYTAPCYTAPVYTAPAYTAPVINYSYSAPLFYNCSTPRHYSFPATRYAGVSYGSPSYASYGYVPGFVNYEGPPFEAYDVPFYVSLTGEDPDADVAAALSIPWRLLAAGRYTDAVSAFAYESEQDPELGEPRIGYALAAAARGDLASGVWAMRRACRYEPAALEQIEINEPLRPELQELVRRYANSDVGRSDAAFMTATLHLLLGDRPAARRAVQGALQNGDYSQSTRSVQQLLGVD